MDARWREIARFDLEDGLSLSIGGLSLVNRRAMIFLCDTRAREFGPRALFCATNRGKRVIQSRDNGRTWSELLILDEHVGSIARFYASSEGAVVQTREPDETIVFDGDGNLIGRSMLSKYKWHGGQGCDQSPTGTFMFAEYQAGFEAEQPVLKVWRRALGATEWYPVLSMRAGKWPEGNIRHFHTCVADHGSPGRWLVSSGDRGNHNRVWLSEDDGLRWREIDVLPTNVCDFGIDVPSRCLRYTSIHLRDGVALWATDDGLGIDRSATVQLSLNDGRPVLRLMDLLGINYTRSLVRWRDRYLGITESKTDPSNVEFHWIAGCGRRLSSHSLSNVEHVRSSVTDSLSSSDFVDDVAFTVNKRLFEFSERGEILYLKLHY